MLLPRFTPRTDWRPPNQWPSWRGAKRIAIDIETCDPDLKKTGPGVRTNGYIAGVAVALEDGPAVYLPVHHQQGDNLDPERVFGYLSAEAREYRGEVVGANLQYDFDFLAQRGVTFWGATWRDVQNAEPLIDELQFRYGLDHVAQRHGLPGKDDSVLSAFAECHGVDPKADMWRLPPEAVGQYAEQDARLPLQLLRRQERKLDAEELFPIFDLECRLQQVLLKMRRRGVRVDFDRVDQVAERAMREEREALAEITRLTGIGLSADDTNKTSSLARVLRHLGVTIPKTETGQDSVTKAFLSSVEHPVADLIRRAKQWNKIRTTFVASVRRHAVGDRLHCTFNQLRKPRDDGSDEEGARYGRLSCSNPNLQQQPARGEFGPMWRAIYVPDEGGEWACLDYSQQEPRWLTHYAELLGLERAAEMAQRYRDDPTADNHNMMATLINPHWPEISDAKAKKAERDAAKIIFLGLCYGMGEAKLARSLGLPLVERRIRGEVRWVAGPEAKELLERFDNGVPFVRQLARAAEGKAARTGYIRTAAGRRCRFPRKIRGGGWDWVHKALNRLIQGSSGDQTKMAMVAADEAGIPLQLQVHDELDLTIGSRREAEQLAEIMREALPCNVPAKVDIEVGPSWGEIK